MRQVHQVHTWGSGIAPQPATRMTRCPLLRPRDLSLLRHSLTSLLPRTSDPTPRLQPLLSPAPYWDVHMCLPFAQSCPSTQVPHNVPLLQEPSPKTFSYNNPFCHSETQYVPTGNSLQKKINVFWALFTSKPHIYAHSA